MNVTLVMVQTLNGKITQGDNLNIESWTSQEDKDFFYSFIQEFSVSIMGSATYNVAKANFQPSSQRKRIILTSDPGKYSSEKKPDEIEFTSKSPKELITRLEHEGYDKVLLLGGGKTNAAFLKEGLVHELFLTLEPTLFGEGKPVVSESDFDASLELIDHKQLNKKGTLLLHYKVTS